MVTIFGTISNDIIDATYSAGTSWGDRVDAGEGDDVVTLGPGVAFINGPGNDTIIVPELSNGSYGGALVNSNDSSPSTYNLKQGKVYDAYGSIDTVSGITEVHILDARGDVIYGSELNEVVFISRGDAKLFLGEGYDSVRVWGQNSNDFVIETAGASTFLFRNGDTIEIKDVEVIEFSDITLSGNYRSDYQTLEPEFLYQTHTWTEAEFSEGWWYAGVYNEPQLIRYFPQAVFPVDIGNDGDLDMAIPMNRGYRTGVDTRYNFQVLENIDGILTFSEEKTNETPFVAGSRRTETIFLKHYESDAIVTIAHDTAIETETRFEIPWRLGDLTVTLLDPFQSIAENMLTNVTLPSSDRTSRATSVDAHSMAVGDLNRDGLDDVLIGEFSASYGLIQTIDGKFANYAESLPNLSTWREPELDVDRSSLLLDLHMEDFNGDGWDDIVAGWGHNSSKSRIFFNSEAGFSSSNSVTLPTPVYGADQIMHMNTWSEDFDGDGDQDLIINQTRFDPYYSGTYLQYLLNDGSGNFTDVTSELLVDPADYPDTYGSRLQWTDMFSVLDVDKDGDFDIAGRYVNWSQPTPIIFLNDGSGKFELIELPIHTDKPVPLSWSDFDGDGKLEFVQFNSTWIDSSKTSSKLSFNVYELGTDDLSIQNKVFVGGQITSRDGISIPSVHINSVETTENGTWDLQIEKGFEFSAEISKDLGNEKVITSQDALDALRLAVGMDTQSGTSTAFDFISADFNQDGKVSSQDALSILKYSVGLPTSEQAKWVFVDTNGDYSGVSKSNTSYTEGVSIADLSADTTVSLTGILIGDVNDSYSGLIA
jgi:hypothetical protein